MRAAALPRGGSQTSGCRQACPAGCARIQALCHSERSESTNAASAETACGLCRARRRETNEVQSNICIVSIQILRRSAPQNDKLLNCSRLRSRLEYATGGNAERWKEKMLGRLRFVEIQSGFSRASRSPALRRLAKLAPRTSAREYFLYHY